MKFIDPVKIYKHSLEKQYFFLIILISLSFTVCLSKIFHIIPSRNLEKKKYYKKIIFKHDKDKLENFIRELNTNINYIKENPNVIPDLKIGKKTNNPNQVFYRYSTNPKKFKKNNVKTLNAKIDCPFGTALNGFHFKESIFNRKKENLTTNSYEYNCYQHKLIQPKFERFKTEPIGLDKTEILNADVKKLLKLKVKCPEALVLIKFRLAFTKENEIYYRYKCAETDVDDESCEYSESNSVKVKEKKNIKKIKSSKEEAIKQEVKKEEEDKTEEKNIENDNKNEEKREIEKEEEKKKENKKGECDDIINILPNQKVEGKKKEEEKKTDKANDNNINEQKDKNEEVRFISLHLIKQLFANAPPGKFIKNFKLIFDEKKNEIFYRIKSCRLYEDEQEENDPDYQLEEDEDNEESEIDTEQEEEILKLPQKVLEKFNIKNQNLNEINEEEEAAVLKKFNRFEFYTIGNKVSNDEKIPINNKDGIMNAQEEELNIIKTSDDLVINNHNYNENAFPKTSNTQNRNVEENQE